MVDSFYSSFCFYLVDFRTEFDYFMPSTLLDVFASFCSRAFNCAVKLLVYAPLSFFLETLRDMSFPPSTALIMFHKFRYVVPSCSLNSTVSLISFFISSLTKLSLSRVQLPRVYGLFVVFDVF